MACCRRSGYGNLEVCNHQFLAVNVHKRLKHCVMKFRSCILFVQSACRAFLSHYRRMPISVYWKLRFQGSSHNVWRTKILNKSTCNMYVIELLHTPLIVTASLSLLCLFQSFWKICPNCQFFIVGRFSQGLKNQCCLIWLYEHIM